VTRGLDDTGFNAEVRLLHTVSSIELKVRLKLLERHITCSIALCILRIARSAKISGLFKLF